MDKEISKLKMRLAAARASSAKRYPSDLRDEVVKLAASWRAAGRKRSELIRALEMSGATLDSWVKPAQSTASSSHEVIRPVELVDDRAEGLVAVLGDNVRVEGLSIADVIALARGLR